jgi:tetratricopeptide (TPR) repeat protein
MKKIILFLLALFAIPAFAQADNPLEKAMKTMKDSKILYKVEWLSKPVPVPDRSKMLNLIVHRKKSGDRYIVNSFDMNADAKKEFDKAEKYFNAKEMPKARESYKRVMLLDPSATYMMTFVAQTYGMEQNWDMAESWYKKSIESNYVDYLAHWLLSDVYLQKGEKKKALDEISIAKVLNRNNPRLEEKRRKIYAANGLRADSWEFNPQVRLSRDSSGAVTIEADSLWMYYAFIRAAWEFEPEYQKRAKTLPEPPEEMYREWLMGLIPAMEKHLNSFEVLKRFDKALSAKKISLFVYYEIYLPDHPASVFQLDKNLIELTKDYLIWINQK